MFYSLDMAFHMSKVCHFQWFLEVLHDFIDVLMIIDDSMIGGYLSRVLFL